MTFKTLLKTTTALAIAGSLTMPVTGALAQDQDSENVLLEEIVVTATKSAHGVNIQDAPVAMTAFGEAQLDALHAKDIQSLSYLSPNVQLETIGTAKGVANFSIRGLGINSSIPSIDPTVGVFVDGVYLGIIAGVVFDTFDLESVEVLRGPQGILFGRNVTGGAVLLNTKKPSDELEYSARASVETGLNYTTSGSLSGPLNADGTIKAKIALYFNEDEGYFTNLADGEEFGKSNTFLVRGAVTFAPSEGFETTINYEKGDQSGQGPASKNNGLFGRNNFDFFVDEPGVADNDWQSITWTTTLDVEFGDGTITNIAGWRDFEGTGTSDIDAAPPIPIAPGVALFGFHADFLTEQDQLSNELRYNGTFGNMDVTSGFYYFTQDINYLEHRLIVGGLVANVTGGGVQDQTTWGVFTQVDYHLNEALTFNVGGRFSSEKKDVNIQTLVTTGTPCTIDAGCTSFDFIDGDKWTSFSPKVGFQWSANENTNVYGFWTIGYRSGGYNFRNTDPAFSPGPFDQEKQNSFELGLKANLLENRLRVNAAIFHNTVDNMQREVNLPGMLGVVQIIDNTADAIIKGFEFDTQYAVTDNITLTANVGYLDGNYKKGSILFDISNDGVVDELDEALKIPRLAPWTYGFGILGSFDTEVGSVDAQVFFNHRDLAFYTDNNLGFLQAADMVDANITVGLGDSGTSISIYGKNLLDEVTIGGDTQLPFFPGSTFSPLNKGRVIGIELKFIG